MFPDSDIKNLYAHLGGDTEAYREIHRQEQGINAANRWTLIRRILRAQVDAADRSPELGHFATFAQDVRNRQPRAATITLGVSPCSLASHNSKNPSKTPLKGLFDCLVSSNLESEATSDLSANADVEKR